MSGRIPTIVIAVGITIGSGLVASPVFSEESDQATLEQGHELFLQHCEYCHGKGIGRGATVILDERYAGAQPGALEDRTNLEAEQVRYYVRNWTPGMASFRPGELSDGQLDILIAWLTRNNPRTDP
jgi:mono/diheme cytochrome c family protein